MTMLYQNPCFNEMSYKGTAMYVAGTGLKLTSWQSKEGTI